MTLRSLISFDQVQLTSAFALTVGTTYAPNSLQTTYGVPGAMTTGVNSNGASILSSPPGWMAMSASNASLYVGYTISFADLNWLQNGATQGWLGFRTYVGNIFASTCNVVGFMTSATFSNNNGANITSVLNENQLARQVAGVGGAQYVEVFVDTVANIFQVYVNGVQVNNGTLPTGLQYVIFSGQVYSSSASQAFRDFYFLDVDSTKPNGRLGPITSTPLAPNLAGLQAPNYGNFIFQLNGASTITNAQAKFGPASFSTNGAANGAVLIPDNSNYRTVTGDMTYEAWCYCTNVSAGGVLFGKDTSAAPYAHLTFSGGSWQVFTDGSTAAITAASNLVVNTWAHIALVRHSGVWTLYENGIVIGTSSTAATFGNNAANLLIGNWGGSSAAWPGFIDEFRISNVARYTGGFTPPTQQFTADSSTMLLLHLDTLLNSTYVADSSGNVSTAFQTAYAAAPSMLPFMQNGADNQAMTLNFTPTAVAGQKVLAMQYKLAAQVPFATNLLAGLKEGSTTKTLPTYQFRDMTAQYGRDLAGIQTLAPDGTTWNATNIAATNLVLQPQSTTAGSVA